MFQVASHPASFNQRAHQYSGTAQSSTNLHLPRQLDRPDFSDIPRDNIAAVAPELVNVPVEYIRRGLVPKTQEMLAGIQALAPSHLPKYISKPRLPDLLSVPIIHHSASLPTHILAVTSARSSNDQAMIFAVHGIVIASHCAQMRLPQSSQSNQTTARLPVLHISPPSAHAFAVLYDYMYTHRLENVLKALLPLPSSFIQGISHNGVMQTYQSRSTIYQLATHVYNHEHGDVQSIMKHVSHCKDVWQDMIALGIFLPELWDTLDLAWKILLGSLNLVTGK